LKTTIKKDLKEDILKMNLLKKKKINTLKLKGKNKQMLKANYTPNNENTITTFTTFFGTKSIKIKLMIDSGSVRSFICKNYVNSNKVPFSSLPSTINIQLPNKNKMNITQTTKILKLKFMDHEENFEFCIANLQLHGVSGILGRDWLNLHKPYINFENNHIYFLEKHCLEHCPSSKGNKFLFHNQNVTAPMIPLESVTYNSMLPEDVYDDPNSDLCAPMIEMESEQTLEEKENILIKYYKEERIAFEKKEADKLPIHRPYDMSIDIAPGSQLFFGPIYSLTDPEMEALKVYIKENLSKGFIRKSKSPAGAPIIFVKKHDGTLRLCVDYRKLNAITIRNSYPIPRINDLIESFKGATIFTRLDLRSAYNLIRIKEGHEYLTAFRTPIGHFEYLVMPFGLRNAPSVFQRFVQDIFSADIGKFLQVYLDDIIIYTNNLEDHIKQVKHTLKKLIKNNLYAKIEKCDFHVQKTKFLGFSVSAEGLLMEYDKLKSISEWPTPKSLKDLQSFLGLCNFYRKFIKNFASIMEPMRLLLKKNTTFLWNKEAEVSFNQLKESFKNNELVIFPDHEKEFVVETDARDFAFGCVLSQVCDKDKLFHPVAFYSRSLTTTEKNYTIYDKELLGVITAFEVWRHHLEGSKFPVQVVTDHKNLLYFKKPQNLNQRQIR